MSANEGYRDVGHIPVASKWPYSDRQYLAKKERSGGEDVDNGHHAGEKSPDAGNRKTSLLSCSKRSWFVIIAAIQSTLTFVHYKHMATSN